MKASTVVALVLLLLATGCSAGSENGAENQANGGIDSTPGKINGSSSYEFEEDDIERAEEAPPSVQAYCEGAVSEAQEVGCLSHVDESEVP